MGIMQVVFMMSHNPEKQLANSNLKQLWNRKFHCCRQSKTIKPQTAAKAYLEAKALAVWAAVTVSGIVMAWSLGMSPDVAVGFSTED